MKNILVVLFLSVLLSACAGGQKFGKKIKKGGAIAASEIPAKMASADSLFLKVTGPVTSVCAKKGCWMNMDLTNDQTMMVRFKDYGFFVPKDAAGQVAIVEGWAFNKVITVEELRHYAEDAGKSKDEIMAITESKSSITFYADGVILSDPK